MSGDNNSISVSIDKRFTCGTQLFSIFKYCTYHPFITASQLSEQLPDGFRERLNRLPIDELLQVIHIKKLIAHWLLSVNWIVDCETARLLKGCRGQWRWYVYDCLLSICFEPVFFSTKISCRWRRSNPTANELWFAWCSIRTLYFGSLLWCPRWKSKYVFAA